MIRFRTVPASVAALVLVWGGLAPADVEAQRPYLPLRPNPGDGYPIVPFMEGWFNNGDGTYTISFGYLNRNDEDLDIPIGPNNSIEPAQFSGMQPTAFLEGRHRGVFTVTLPEGMGDSEVWWRITANGEQTETPGRTASNAYELDRRPRPHGTVAPLLWFGNDAERGQYPQGVVASGTRTVQAGELLTLTIHAEDPAERDPTDRRFQEPVGVNLSFFKHQGPPGEIEWVHHPSTTFPDLEAGEDPPDADEWEITEDSGTFMVQARFPAPGEWMVRVEADSHNAPDSSSGDQCCWTNGYVRVNVTP